MIDQSTLEFLKEVSAEITPCGSRITCSPPPLDTDQDYLVVIPSKRVAEVMTGLNTRGFSWEGSTVHYQNQLDDGFSSFRNGDINLIVTANPEFARKHKAATALCTRLNLLNKPDRIALFQAVLYGVMWAKG